MQTTNPRSSSWKWWITGLLLLATTINYMDRQTLSNAAVRVSKEFGLKQEQYGDLELAFGWAFAVGSLVFGFLADRFRVYWLYPVVLSGWSLMGIASAHTDGYWPLLTCRVLLGFFEAGHWPCALKTTFALLEPKDRTMGNSVLQSGASIGAVVTPPLMIWLMTEEISSWRLAFEVIGAIGLVWVVIWFAAIRKTELDVVIVDDPAKRESLCDILLGRRFWALAVLIFGAQTCWHLFRVWLPKFMQEGRGYSETEALAFNSAYYIGTDIGCFAAGLISLWLARRFALSAHNARRWVYAGACVLTSFSVLVLWLPKGWALMAAILVVGAGALALFPCYYSFVQELSVRHVGRLTGLLSMWVWAVSSPMHKLFGRLVDETKSFDLGMAMAGLAPWLGVIAMKLLWRDDQATTRPSKTAGVAATVIGILLMVFGAIQRSSAESQLRRALGETDVLGILLLIGGGIALLVGLSRLVSHPGSPDSPPSKGSIQERLRRLDDLRSRQLISEEEYDQKRKEIIDSL